MNVNEGWVMVVIDLSGLRLPLCELFDTPDEEAPFEDEELLLLDGVSESTVMVELGFPGCFAPFRATLGGGPARGWPSLPAVVAH